MRALLLLFPLVLMTVYALAQQQANEQPSFQLLRANEDYSALRTSTSNSLWSSLKYIALGDSSFVSIGGDVRTQFQVLTNENWQKGNNDAALFQRFMLHTDWHFGQKIRLFAQFKNGFTIGRNGPPFFLDDDPLDVHQLFAGFKLGKSTLELGRRELWYGSRRLLSIREGTNIRQSFDGARWIFKHKALRFDALFYAYNTQRTGLFDNRIDTDHLLWGFYSVWKLPTNTTNTLDFYYLGVRNQEALFDEATNKEIRHSVGIRHAGNSGSLKYNSEFIYQFGSFGSGQINAWTISTELYYTLQSNWKPTLGLKAEIISGDKTNGDGDLQTFNALYPRGGYFGLLALVGPANLMDVHPSLKLIIAKDWMLNLDWDFFWRHQLEDGIYLPSGRLNLSNSESDQGFIGHQPGIQLAYTINAFMDVEASYFIFFPGTFLEEVSDGARFSQFGTSFSFRF